jgi:glycosyltransferase involved in cell wall biosynthesis
MEDYFQQLQEAAAGDKRIIFAGFVEGQLLHELHSNCYLYCLPSELEGMPISLLEALSHGSCCVCSDIPECTEVVGDFGFSFPAGDRDALRRLLERLCREPETVKASRERVRQGFAHYTWDEVTERTLALYEGAKV